MVKGLLWFPLLIVFIGLAWAGWQEFQKVEAYRTWAVPFDRAKYDIYAVLGQKGTELTWGKPSRKGPIDLQTFSLQQVKVIQLWANDQSVEMDNLPKQGREVAIEFQLQTGEPAIRIPFTDLSLAAQWTQALQRDLQMLQAL